MDTHAIGDKVRRARFSRGKMWTQKKLAEAAGLSQGYISAIERGEEFPSLKALQRIAEVLDCPLKEFIDEQTDGALLMPEETRLHRAVPGTPSDHLLREALTQMIQAALERPAIVNQLVDQVLGIINGQLESLEARIAQLEGTTGRDGQVHPHDGTLQSLH